MLPAQNNKVSHLSVLVAARKNLADSKFELRSF